MWCRGVLPAALPAPFSATLSPALSAYLSECGAAGSASGQTACPFCPTLRQSWSRHGNASPLRPSARLRPSYRSGCMFIFYFLGVGLPCRSIFCQFWLCKEAQCVYLRCHLGSLHHFPFLTRGDHPLQGYLSDTPKTWGQAVPPRNVQVRSPSPETHFPAMCTVRRPLQ